MDKILNCEIREKAGVKGVLSVLRREGGIPATLYGEQSKSVSIRVPKKEFLKLIAKDSNAIIKLKYSGKEEDVMVKEIQRHVVTDNVIHIDFKRISLTENIEVNVNIHLTGEAAGVKNQGGLLQHGLRELLIKCLPSDIPSDIKIDISEMNIGDIIRVKDIKFDKKGFILDNPETVIVSIAAPKAEKEEEETAAAAVPETAEPEVVEKGKKEEDKGTE